MKKHYLTLMVLVFVLGIVFSIAIATAGENPLVNEVASKIKNNESNNQSVNQSINQGTNISANVSETVEEIPENGQKNFRVSPTVVLRPVNNVITKNEDGSVELYIDNPAFNEMTLNLDVRISIPNGIYVYGQNLSQTDSEDVVYGNFSLSPGSSQKTYIAVKAAKEGNFTVYLSGLYWAGDDEEDYTPISLVHSFVVKEPSKNPEKPPVFNENGTVKTEESFGTPGFSVFIAIAGLLVVYAIKIKKI